MQVNLLKRIKNVQVKEDTTIWLERALERYNTTGSVMEIFD